MEQQRKEEEERRRIEEEERKQAEEERLKEEAKRLKKEKEKVWPEHQSILTNPLITGEKRTIKERRETFNKSTKGGQIKSPA